MDTLEPVKIVPKRGRLAFYVALAVFIVSAVGVWAAFAFMPAKIQTTHAPEQELGAGQADNQQPVTHLPLPTEVRGIYITAASAGAWDQYQNLVVAAKGKGVNAVVVDLKVDSGALAFKPTSPALADDAPRKETIADLDRLTAFTHEQGMYLIARISVFEDPDHAERHPQIALKRADGSLWRDRRGLSWVDAAAESAWKYNADIAKEAYARGFDEIQFDYVRFATDGDISQIVYPVYDSARENFRGTIGRFFAYLDAELRGAGIPISVDLFGFTAWHQNDLGIGQWYDDAVRHFDFVSPMVYPSHYPDGTLDYKNPADHPYEIVLDSLKKGNEVIDAARAADPIIHLASQRPWLQAFNMGAVYTPAMMLDQVRASRETGSTGFMFWNAGNDYSSLPTLN